MLAIKMAEKMKYVGFGLSSGRDYWRIKGNEKLVSFPSERKVRR